MLTDRVDQVRDHLRTPLFANAYALIASTGVTTVLGFAYWIVAARLYPIEEVGRGQTAINALIILSGLGSFRLISALTRFLPRGGDRSRALVIGCYGAATLGSIVVGAFYVLVFRGSDGVAGYLGAGWLTAVALVASVVVWSIFTLQDAALTGLRKAVWVPIENGIHGVAKLIMLPLFAWAGFMSTGVFASWMIPTVIALVPVNYLIFRWLLPERAAATTHREEFSRRTLQHYVGADYIGSLCELAVVNLIPLVIASQLGLEAVGYFGPTWMIATMLEHVLVHYGASLTVEGVAEPHRLASLTRDLLRRSVVPVIVLAVGIAAAAPLLLALYGPGFADRVTTMLQLCAIALVPRLVIHVALTAARVRGEIRRVVGIQIAVAVLTFAVSMPLLDSQGLTAPGIGYLVSSVVVAVALIPQIVGLLREQPVEDGVR